MQTRRSRRPHTGRRRVAAVTALLTALIAAVPAASAAAAGDGAKPKAATAPAGQQLKNNAQVAPRTTLPDQPDMAGAFVPAGPTRLLDTRDGTGTGGAVKPVGQAPLLLDVSQVTGNTSVVPTAVVLNVTVTGPSEESYLAVYPAGIQHPNTSNLNFGRGQTVPNLVTVPVGADGKVAFFNHLGTTDVVADLAGYYTLDKAASTYVANGPSRVLDTRDGTGTGGTRSAVGEGRSIDLKVTGVAGVPAADVSAVVLNVTVTEPTAESFVTVYPTGKAVPTASNLNFGRGQTVPNLVTVPVGADGKISFFNHIGSTHVVADIAGYYLSGKPATGGVLRTPSAPKRLLDTRDGTGLGGTRSAIGEGKSVDLKVTGVGEVPATGVTAVVLNVTVTEPTAESFLTVYPTGKAVPTASNLNFGRGQTVPNLVTVPVGADGKISFFNHIGSTHVVADLFGFYSGGDKLALTDLSFSQSTVDASAAATPVTVKWTVTDSDPSATQVGGTLIFRQQGATPDSYVGQPYLIDFMQENSGYGSGRLADFVSGDAAKSSYSYSFVVPQYAAATSTKWTVSLVNLFEIATQQRQILSGSALSGFGNVLTATEQVPTPNWVTPEVSVQLNGRHPYVYTAEAGLADYQISIQASPVGFWKGSLELTGPGGRKLSSGFELATYNGQTAWPCQQEPNYPTCDTYVRFPADTPAGDWKVSAVTLTNNAGQSKTFTGLDPQTVTTTSNGVVSVSDIKANPAQPNSWQGPAPFKVSMRVAGARNGVSSVDLNWEGNCYNSTSAPTQEADGSYSVTATLGQSGNGSAASCKLVGLAVHDGAGNLSVYGAHYYGSPDPGLVVKSVPDTTPPTVTSASLNVTSIAQSKASSQSFAVIAEVVSPTAPLTGYSSYVYDSTGKVVGQAGGSATVGPDGKATLNLYLPYGIAVGTYTVGFSISDAGWLTSYYGMPNKPQVPGGPLTLTITAG